MLAYFSVVRLQHFSALDQGFCCNLAATCFSICSSCTTVKVFDLVPHAQGQSCFSCLLKIFGKCFFCFLVLLGQLQQAVSQHKHFSIDTGGRSSVKSFSFQDQRWLSCLHQWCYDVGSVKPGGAARQAYPVYACRFLIQRGCLLPIASHAHGQEARRSKRIGLLHKLISIRLSHAGPTLLSSWMAILRPSLDTL